MFGILSTKTSTPEEARQHGRRAWVEDRRRQEQALHNMARALDRVAEENARNLEAGCKALAESCRRLNR